MGGKSSGADYGALAASQGEDNEKVIRDQIYANRPTQYTPWGYTQWDQNQVLDDASGEMVTEWSQRQGLSDELQRIFDKQVATQEGRTDIAGMLTGRMGAEFGNQMDWSGLTPMGNVPGSQFTLPEGDVGDPNAFRQHAEDSMYNQAQSRLAPAQEGAREALEIKMRNQGLGPEDAAWQSQVTNLGNTHTDQNNQAMWSASQAGRDEANQMWNQGMGQNQNNFNQALNANNQNYSQAMSGSAYANQIRQQQMTEAMQQRGFSLNEINALLSGQQVSNPQMPNFSQAAAAAPAPNYQAGVDSGNAAAAGNPMNGLMGLGGQLGGAFLGTL